MSGAAVYVASVARVTGLTPSTILNALPYAQGLQYQTIDLARNGAKFAATETAAPPGFEGFG